MEYSGPPETEIQLSLVIRFMRSRGALTAAHGRLLTGVAAHWLLDGWAFCDLDPSQGSLSNRALAISEERLTALRGVKVFRRGDRLSDLVSQLTLYLDLQTIAVNAVADRSTPPGPRKGHCASLVSTLFGVLVQIPIYFHFAASFNRGGAFQPSRPTGRPSVGWV